MVTEADDTRWRTMRMPSDPSLRSGRHHPEDVHLLLAAPQLHRGEGVILPAAGCGGTDAVGDEDFPGTGFGAESRRHVYYVAQNGVFQPSMAADVAHENFAVVDADAAAEPGPAAG